MTVGLCLGFQGLGFRVMSAVAARTSKRGFTTALLRFGAHTRTCPARFLVRSRLEVKPTIERLHNTIERSSKLKRRLCSEENYARFV